MRSSRFVRLAVRCLAAVLLPLLSLAGCLQLDTHVKLHEDGSATITERLQFSRRLLEYRGEGVPEEGIESLLRREAILERMRHMGEGIEMVSHEVRDADRGAREAVSVFKIPKLTDFKYVSPYVGAGNYAEHHVIECREWPMFENTWDGRRAGWMAIQFRAPGAGSGPEAGQTSPADAQVYRHLQPVFQDMMDGLHLKFTFECYSPVVVRRAGQRAAGTRPRKAHLIDFAWDNNDQSGSDFLGNEEVMIELLQMYFNGPNMQRQSGFADSIPLFRFGNRAPEFLFQPSRHYFDEYFAGKDLNFGRAGQRQADPERDVYRPEAEENDGE